MKSQTVLQQYFAAVLHTIRGQDLGFVVKGEDLRLVHRDQLGVDGMDVCRARGAAGQLSLPQRVIAPGNADGGPPQHHHLPPGSRFWA
jgi:hypothetical protein